MYEDDHLTLLQNEISGSPVGIWGELPAAGANLLDNQITAVCTGVLLDSWAGG